MVIKIISNSKRIKEKVHFYVSILAGAVQVVELPVNKTITAMGLDLNGNTLFLHRAEVIDNEYSLHACSTKLIGRANTKALAENWKWRSGWHRVVVYGDWKEKLKDLASLLNLKVIEEDRL